MRLDPSESMNNQGTLRVEVLDAADLPAADRNGFSDPYCKFNLDGKEVYKTKTQKKTLHPAWNEAFEVSVRSRTSAKFEVVIYDYDFGDSADLLGKAVIDLKVLDPFRPQEVTMGLDGESGAIRLKMLFRPDYITRSRQGSSTFQGTFAAPGKVVGTPVKSLGRGAMSVGGGVVKGASFFGRSFKRRKSQTGEELAANGNGTPVPGTPDNRSLHLDASDSPPVTAVPTIATGGPAIPHRRDKSLGAHSISSAVSPSIMGDSGTASLTILSASGFEPGANLRVHVKVEGPKGIKEVHKTKAVKAPAGEAQFAGEHDSCKVACTADAQFRIVVKDHSTFGADEELGEGVFFVDDQGVGGGERDVMVGRGRVSVRSGFAHADGGSVSGGLGAGNGVANSPGKTLRKSFIGRRERSVTPGT